MDYKNKPLPQILSTLKAVFGDVRYVLLAVFIAVGFYLFNVLVFIFKTLYAIYPSFGIGRTLQFFFISALGFKSVIMVHSYWGLLITSVLLGILFSLLVYKTKMANSQHTYKSGLFGWTGTFLAFLAPGCAACGIGLVSFLGLSGGLISFLPYEGFELTLLSILLLAFAIGYVSKNIYICPLPYKIDRAIKKKNETN